MWGVRKEGFLRGFGGSCFVLFCFLAGFFVQIVFSLVSFTFEVCSYLVYEGSFFFFLSLFQVPYAIFFHQS